MNVRKHPGGLVPCSVQEHGIGEEHFRSCYRQQEVRLLQCIRAVHSHTGMPQEDGEHLKIGVETSQEYTIDARVQPRCNRLFEHDYTTFHSLDRNKPHL